MTITKLFFVIKKTPITITLAITVDYKVPAINNTADLIKIIKIGYHFVDIDELILNL